MFRLLLHHPVVRLLFFHFFFFFFALSLSLLLQIHLVTAQQPPPPPPFVNRSLDVANFTLDEDALEFSAGGSTNLVYEDCQVSSELVLRPPPHTTVRFRRCRIPIVRLVNFSDTFVFFEQCELQLVDGVTCEWPGNDCDIWSSLLYFRRSALRVDSCSFTDTLDESVERMGIVFRGLGIQNRFAWFENSTIFVRNSNFTITRSAVSARSRMIQKAASVKHIGPCTLSIAGNRFVVEKTVTQLPEGRGGQFVDISFDVLRSSPLAGLEQLRTPFDADSSIIVADNIFLNRASVVAPSGLGGSTEASVIYINTARTSAHVLATLLIDRNRISSFFTANQSQPIQMWVRVVSVFWGMVERQGTADPEDEYATRNARGNLYSVSNNVLRFLTFFNPRSYDSGFAYQARNVRAMDLSIGRQANRIVKVDENNVFVATPAFDEPDMERQMDALIQRVADAVEQPDDDDKFLILERWFDALRPRQHTTAHKMMFSHVGTFLIDAISLYVWGLISSQDVARDVAAGWTPPPGVADLLAAATLAEAARCKANPDAPCVQLTVSLSGNKVRMLVAAWNTRALSMFGVSGAPKENDVWNQLAAPLNIGGRFVTRNNTVMLPNASYMQMTTGLLRGYGTGWARVRKLLRTRLVDVSNNNITVLGGDSQALPFVNEAFQSRLNWRVLECTFSSQPDGTVPDPTQLFPFVDEVFLWRVSGNRLRVEGAVESVIVARVEHSGVGRNVFRTEVMDNAVNLTLLAMRRRGPSGGAAERGVPNRVAVGLAAQCAAPFDAAVEATERQRGSLVPRDTPREEARSSSVGPTPFLGACVVQGNAAIIDLKDVFMFRGVGHGMSSQLTAISLSNVGNVSAFPLLFALRNQGFLIGTSMAAQPAFGSVFFFAVDGVLESMDRIIFAENEMHASALWALRSNFGAVVLSFSVAHRVGSIEFRNNIIDVESPTIVSGVSILSAPGRSGTSSNNQGSLPGGGTLLMVDFDNSRDGVVRLEFILFAQNQITLVALPPPDFDTRPTEIAAFMFSAGNLQVDSCNCTQNNISVISKPFPAAVRSAFPTADIPQHPRAPLFAVFGVSGLTAFNVFAPGTFFTKLLPPGILQTLRSSVVGMRVDMAVREIDIMDIEISSISVAASEDVLWAGLMACARPTHSLKLGAVNFRDLEFDFSRMNPLLADANEAAATGGRVLLMNLTAAGEEAFELGGQRVQATTAEGAAQFSTMEFKQPRTQAERLRIVCEKCDHSRSAVSGRRLFRYRGLTMDAQTVAADPAPLLYGSCPAAALRTRTPTFSRELTESTPALSVSGSAEHSATATYVPPPPRLEMVGDGAGVQAAQASLSILSAAMMAPSSFVVAAKALLANRLRRCGEDDSNTARDSDELPWSEHPLAFRVGSAAQSVPQRQRMGASIGNVIVVVLVAGGILAARRFVLKREHEKQEAKKNQQSSPADKVEEEETPEALALLAIRWPSSLFPAVIVLGLPTIMHSAVIMSTPREDGREDFDILTILPGFAFFAGGMLVAFVWVTLKGGSERLEKTEAQKEIEAEEERREEEAKERRRKREERRRRRQRERRRMKQQDQQHQRHSRKSRFAAGGVLIGDSNGSTSSSSSSNDDDDDEETERQRNDRERRENNNDNNNNKTPLWARFKAFIFFQKEEWQDSHFLRANGIVFESFRIIWFCLFDLCASMSVAVLAGLSLNCDSKKCCTAIVSLHLTCIFVHIVVLMLKRPLLGRGERLVLDAAATCNLAQAILIIVEHVLLQNSVKGEDGLRTASTTPVTPALDALLVIILVISYFCLFYTILPWVETILGKLKDRVAGRVGAFLDGRQQPSGVGDEEEEEEEELQVRNSSRGGRSGAAETASRSRSFARGSEISAMLLSERDRHRRSSSSASRSNSTAASSPRHRDRHQQQGHYHRPSARAQHDDDDDDDIDHNDRFRQEFFQRHQRLMPSSAAASSAAVEQQQRRHNRDGSSSRRNAHSSLPPTDRRSSSNKAPRQQQQSRSSSSRAAGRVTSAFEEESVHEIVHRNKRRYEML